MAMKLEKLNSHPFDQYICFEECNHKYTIKFNNYVYFPISVTTLIHKYFQPFNSHEVITKMMNSKNWSESKYYGMTEKQISDKWSNDGKEASNLGTVMHRTIELFLNDELAPNDVQSRYQTFPEFNYFINFWNFFQNRYPGFHPYRTEWVVYDFEIKLAGSIDFVLRNEHNQYMILDWKRSKEIKVENRFQKGNPPFENYDDCNFNHYTLQLNFYRHMLENIYQKPVVLMMLVILHPNNNSFQLYEVNRVDLSSIWPKINNPQNFTK